MEAEGQPCVDLKMSRLGAIISALQSAEYLLETVATRLVGAHGGWTVVTLLESWRAACRLRLLSLQQGSPLLLSTVTEEVGGGRWSSVASRIGARVSLRERASKLAQESGCSSEHVRTDLTTARTLGELLHILQPLAYLLMLLVQRTRRQTPQGRDPSRLHALATRLPWLVSLSLETIALYLCSKCSGVPARHIARVGSAVSSLGGSVERVPPREAAELAHRWKLALLFLLRPGARAATRALLVCLSKRRSPAAIRGSFRHALELIDSLDETCAFRYFRTHSPDP